MTMTDEKSGELRSRAAPDEASSNGLSREQIRRDLPLAPDSLVDFIAEMEVPERETYVKRLKVMPAEYVEIP